MARKKTDDFEVQLMEFRKDIEYLKEGQKKQQNESNLRHAELKSIIETMEDKLTKTFKDNLKGYVTVAMCKEFHIGGELQQEKKESDWKGTALGVIIGIIGTIFAGIVIFKWTHII